MTKEDAINTLINGGYVNYEGYTWMNYQFTCSYTDEEYECCREDFNSIEETIKHLQDFCKGRWDDVY